MNVIFNLMFLRLSILDKYYISPLNNLETNRTSTSDLSLCMCMCSFGKYHNSQRNRSTYEFNIHEISARMEMDLCQASLMLHP